MRKLTLILVAMLVVAALTYSQRATIAQRIMSRGVDMAMNTDTLAELVYYHIVPPLIFPGMESAWLAGVGELFENYTLSQDGTSFTLPPNSKEIIRTRYKIQGLRGTATVLTVQSLQDDTGAPGAVCSAQQEENTDGRSTR